MTGVHRHARALCLVWLLASSPGLLGAGPVVDDVYGERGYQRDLPGSPGSCQGDGCADAQSNQTSTSRLRGADSTYNEQTFGTSQGDGFAQGGEDEWGSSGGSSVYDDRGTIGGEFEEADRPTLCELHMRAGGGRDAAECKQEGLSGRAGAGTGSGSGSGFGMGTGSGSGTGTGFGEGDAMASGDEPGGEPGGEEGTGSMGDSTPGGVSAESDDHGEEESPGKRGDTQQGDSQPTAEQPPYPVDLPPIPRTVEEEVMPEIEQDAPRPSFGEVMQTLLTVLAIVLLVVVLALGARALMRRMAPRGAGRMDELDEEDVEGAEQLISELQQRTGGRSHDEWAVEMRYEEAIHALLLSALRTTLRHRHELARPSITSREILQGARFTSAPHAALETLVRAAELCVFARREGTEAMYRACKQAHEELIASLDSIATTPSSEDAA